MTSAPSFSTLGLRRELLVSLALLGFERPTPIQQDVIPRLLAGRDVVMQAETGSGKTLAYGLPLLHAIAGTPLRPRLLVLVPTRELALQVRDVLREVAKKWRPAIHSFVGGEPIEPQLKLLEKGAAVVIATPGRFLDLSRRGALKLKNCRMVVLDEADEMILHGFRDDLDAILALLPAERQTVLASATMGPEIHAYAAQALREPATVEVTRPMECLAPKEPAPKAERELPALPTTLEHYLVEAGRDAKVPLLTTLLSRQTGMAMVFVRLKEETKRLAMRLRQAGIAAAYLNGDLPQENRRETISRFREGIFRVLVATDVAARGLDIPEVELVVNYSVPPDFEQYVHRAGRTGRAGRGGRAVTFSYREEAAALKKLKEAITLSPLRLKPQSEQGDKPKPWRPPVQADEPETPLPSTPKMFRAPRKSRDGKLSFDDPFQPRKTRRGR